MHDAQIHRAHRARGTTAVGREELRTCPQQLPLNKDPGQIRTRLSEAVGSLLQVLSVLAWGNFNPPYSRRHR